jgi:DNA-binding MarR family transcriptional regulator
LSSEEPRTPSDEQSAALKSLGEQLSDPALRSTTRILILVSLAVNGKLGFLDLLGLTGMGKGSLSNHLEKLEAGGYIKTRRVMVFGGHRVMAEITEKGLRTYESYLSAMRLLAGASRNHTPAV